MSDMGDDREGENSPCEDARRRLGKNRGIDGEKMMTTRWGGDDAVEGRRSRKPRGWERRRQGRQIADQHKGSGSEPHEGMPGRRASKARVFDVPRVALFIQFLFPCRQLLYDIKKQGAGRGALESGDLPSPHRIDHALSIDSVDTKRTCPEIQNGSLKLLYK